jgi:poly(hydroxyalkanoate) depolymerase family esterase
MNNDFVTTMRQALLATRAHDVGEATRLIRNVLSGRGSASAAYAAPSDIERQGPTARAMLNFDDSVLIPAVQGAEATPVAPASSQRVRSATTGVETSKRLRKPLGEVLQILRAGRLRPRGSKPTAGADLLDEIHLLGGIHSPDLPAGARFQTRSFACSAGTRNFKLFVPSSVCDNARGLIVMLHGCKQDPDDFAAGTNMNALAEAHRLIIAYPSQAHAANASSCWNWFSPADQMRDAGEPAILAGLTREIMLEYGLDREQVFIAGLSAGGAMAAVMGETYPDLYAAIGIHSGLAYGSANDVLSAFVAMRGDAGAANSTRRRSSGAKDRVRTIIFQGSADRTVHPSNADRIFALASLGGARQDYTRSVGGRTLTHTIVAGPDGTAMAEYWLIDGAGHAWVGGQAGGSFTDQRGPNASAEMVRFFLNPSDYSAPRP